MGKQFLLLVSILFFIGCMRVPINRLNYLNNYRYNNEKLKTKGCYYYEYNAKSYTKGEIKRVGYLVFFKNGLFRYGNYDVIDSIPVEYRVIQLLEKYKDLPYFWGDYKTVNDSIYLERIYSIGMAPREIENKFGVIKNDSIIKIFKTPENENSSEVKIYEFLPFSTLPDSTGYLYDKLKKIREK
jgi:hypothetical protein